MFDLKKTTYNFRYKWLIIYIRLTRFEPGGGRLRPYYLLLVLTQTKKPGR